MLERTLLLVEFFRATGITTDDVAEYCTSDPLDGTPWVPGTIIVWLKTGFKITFIVQEELV